jgi:hypothetical protein
MTPEGSVKEKVKRVLAQYKEHLHGNWPVQNGMGTPMLDYVGCCCGHYFAIETKAPGEKMTPRQLATAKAILLAGGVVFEISDEQHIVQLAAWIYHTIRTSEG